MDWRVWLFETLAGHAGVAALLNDPDTDIYGAGGIDSPPVARPFIEIRAGTKIRGPFPGVSQQYATIWVHDAPGDYMLIDSLIEQIKDALSGSSREASVSETDGVSCRWMSDSQELADDGYGTITRNTQFQLNGKEGNG